ncbi:MAG: hypothetical protein RR202_05145 [Bacteroidales bacterium]
MKQMKLNNPADIRTLKELRYEKAKVKIEMTYLEQEIKSEYQSFINGGFLHMAGKGFSLFSTAGKWMVFGKIGMKVFKWIRGFLKKRSSK